MTMTEERAQEVIEQARAALGRTWKSQIAQAWYDGNYPWRVREIEAELQQIRNSTLRARKRCIPRT